MEHEHAQVTLSDELLALMRSAAQSAAVLKEQFITPRVLLLALLDERTVGGVLSGCAERERLEAIAPADIDLSGVSRDSDEHLSSDEEPALLRYDTIAFKTPNGADTRWLDKDALRIFVAGAQRVQETYRPKELVLGFAAQAVQHPAAFSAIHIDTAALIDAAYTL